MNKIIFESSMSGCHQNQLEWYKIRDTLLGFNRSTQDVKKALELAAVCEHPDAVWLTKLFAGYNVASVAQAKQIFLNCTENNPSAVCLAALLRVNNYDIIRAANAGDAFAQARMVWMTYGEARFRWAEQSAAQGERDGFYGIGFCYIYGEGCEQNLEKAKKFLLFAANLGCVDAMYTLVHLLGKNDPQRYIWLGKAAVCGDIHPLIQEIMTLHDNFGISGIENNVVFAIGKAIKGHIDNDKHEFFGSKNYYSSYANQALQFYEFYEFQLQAYRKVINTWTVVGKHYGVVKDIRKMIGMMIWDSMLTIKNKN